MNDQRVTLPEGKPLILLLARDRELADALGRFADSAGMHLVQSDTAIDLIGMTAAAHVVDLDVCDSADWQAVREYLAECGEGAMADDTPLIVVNHREDNDALLAGLAKPGGTIHRCGAGCADAVVGLVATHASAGR